MGSIALPWVGVAGLPFHFFHPLPWTPIATATMTLLDTPIGRLQYGPADCLNKQEMGSKKNRPRTEARGIALEYDFLVTGTPIV